MTVEMGIDWPNTILNSATLLAALGAVGISWYGIQQQRSHSIAGFRKQWIEELRADIAEYLTIDHQIVMRKIVQDSALATLKQTDDQSNSFLSEKISSTLLDNALSNTELRANRLGKLQIIRLKLNPDEKLQANLLDSIEKHNSRDEDENSGKLVKNIIDSTRLFLKTEWDSKVVFKSKS